jgi:arylsulfatase A-like enzyme
MQFSFVTGSSCKTCGSFQLLRSTANAFAAESSAMNYNGEGDDLKMLNISILYVRQRPNTQFVRPLNSAGGLHGIKRRLYEGDIRAAMAVRWPGKVPAGRTSDFIWDMRDVFPTACEMAKATPPGNLDGMSVLPTLLGKEQQGREFHYWEYHDPFHQAVRMGKWKGIRFGTKRPVNLYDLEHDRKEAKNIAVQHPEIVKKMVKVMEDSHTVSPYWP